MTPSITVVVPAYNPRLDFLNATLEALSAQTLDRSSWSLIVVDNMSDLPLQDRVDLSWHSGAEWVREERLGLTPARLAGFRRAEGAVIVLVDDDNRLRPDFLERSLEISRSHPFLGTWAGAVEPRFERPDLAPPKSLFPLLTLREVTEDMWSNDVDHHVSTPWGAGLCVRREVFDRYSRNLEECTLGLELDLQGERLVYGGDTDIAFTGCAMGLGKGVFKALQVEHLIPASRCSGEYLCRVAEGRGYSEVLHCLVRTGKLPEIDSSLAGWFRRQRSVRVGTVIERRAARARLAGMKRARKEFGERA